MKQLKFGEWTNTSEVPLVNKSNGYWVVNEDIPDEFIAALRVHDTKINEHYWWIRHCAIREGIGLVVVGDNDDEPCGWEIEDVECFMPLPYPPYVLPKINQP